MIGILKKFWFVVLIGVLFLSAIVYFVYDDNKDKVGGKTENGQDVVYSINDDNITADEFYDEMFKATGISGIYQFLSKTVTDASVETTDEMIEGAKLNAESVIEQFKSQYGIDYEAALTQSLQGLGYDSIDDLQEYFVNLAKSQMFITDYINANVDTIYPAYEEASKPRTLSHILVTMVDSKNPTEEELAKVTAVEEALASGTEFGAVAYEFSDDTASAVENGSLGLTDANTEFVPEFLAASLLLAEGEVSEWVKTEFGYHMIKCDAVGYEKLSTDYKDQLLQGMLTFNPFIEPQAIWAKSQELGVTFANEQIESDLKEFMQVDQGDAE